MWGGGVLGGRQFHYGIWFSPLHNVGLIWYATDSFL